MLNLYSKIIKFTQRENSIANINIFNGLGALVNLNNNMPLEPF